MKKLLYVLSYKFILNHTKSHQIIDYLLQKIYNNNC